MDTRTKAAGRAGAVRLLDQPRPPAAESPEAVAGRLVRELRAALNREGRVSFRFGETADGLRLTVGATTSFRPPDPVTDLPLALRAARPSVQAAYRAVRELRAANPDAPLWPADVVAWLEANGPDIVSVDTVNHALRALRDAGLARSDRRAGWRLRQAPQRVTARRGIDGA